ncbi:MAG TPA: type II toxin-antitoxin system PemK/MazF family toxin [Rhizomicrobium sp.]|nr:type II toxin-antitoxin system PemK/MazF family toxin [Rhizomicrobium sp.]
MPFEFGDVVLLPFPFTNQTASKKRPAIVVSNIAYNAARPDVMVMAITSQLRRGPTGSEAWIQDWQVAGLLKPSAVKPVLATVEQRLINKTMGKMTAADIAAVRDLIARILK